MLAGPYGATLLGDLGADVIKMISGALPHGMYSDVSPERRTC
jgi:crotonobetainyl-CoA:carnitine CoA-transferase CaiB-like acyl-CoA transferase